MFVKTGGLEPTDYLTTILPDRIVYLFTIVVMLSILANNLQAISLKVSNVNLMVLQHQKSQDH